MLGQRKECRQSLCLSTHLVLAGGEVDPDPRLHGVRVPKEGCEAKGEPLLVFSLDVTEAKLEIRAGFS